ncbi:MAG: HAMP domain-containing protein [Deltaproteobacteria bacterium]|nr:HAMP domain-containing protein [Deltaproteobacteria bacterium]
MWRLLVAFLLLAAVPLGGVGYYVSHQLIQVRESVNRAATTYERRAQSIAKRVSDLLRECEADLKKLADLPREEESYLAFANERTRKVWVRAGTNDRITERRGKELLYKEISYIDANGVEQILVRQGRPVPASSLRDVSDPRNTTYRSERYFLEAIKNKPGEIYVSHLNGFHLNKFDQLGLEKIISGLKDVDARTRQIYRHLMYEALKAAGAVEYVNTFDEDDRRVLVYRVPGDESRILVDDPGEVTNGERQARKRELKDLIDKLGPEDVVEGERYDGVIRFAMPVTDSNGSIEGVVSLALDHMHLMQFTQHVKAMVENAVAFAGYRGADYTYLFDDQGWIITHPKLWDIRGVDRLGKPVPAYTEETSDAERFAGLIPINLLQLDWKAGAGYHKVVLEPRNGKTGTIWHFNLGGVPRTRIYSPIFYDTGAYAKHGIFGGVMLGADSQSFIDLMRQMNTDIASQVFQLRRSIYWPLVLVLFAVAALSIIVARGLVKPLRLLSETARRIGKGDLDTPIPTGRKDEIGDLAGSFSEMAGNLKRTFEKLEGRNVELKQTQQKLLMAQKEKQQRLEREVADLQQEIKSASFMGMVAESPEMKKILEEIVRVAASKATVLIRGDNGTGKELVAEAIHRNGSRREKKFLRVNCAAFNDNLLESEMFGHVKGSYTGASADRKGLFESADGGTLLLDEVGDMSLEMQKKLLRTLQEGEIVPLGSGRVIKVDVRLLASTNRDLNQMMKSGAFREDLYHRLNVITIRIPPLCERKEDILPLTRLFMRKFADGEAKPITGMTNQAERFLLEYPWPGNVRELENAMERAVIRSRRDELSQADFQLTAKERDLPVIEEGVGRDWTLAEVEKAYILSVLDHNGGNKKLTAEILGIGYNTLWRKLKKYNAGQ